MLLNSYMKLIEVLAPSSIYFIAANAQLGQAATREDLKILPDGRYHLTEAALERFRPDSCFPRASSILLAQSREDLRALNQRAGLLYQTVSLGVIQWSDAQWVQKIREAMELPIEERPSCEEWARAYWAGTACPIGTPLWEGRTQAVQIIRAAH